MDHQGMVDILEQTVKRNPNTIFIACHLANCCYNLNIIGDLLDQYPNLYIDTGAYFAESSAIPRIASAFFIKYHNRRLHADSATP